MSNQKVIGPLRRVAVVKRHLAPIHPGTGTDQSVHAGGRGRIKVPKFKSRREALDYITDNFLQAKVPTHVVDGSLGQLRIAEDEPNLDGSEKVTVLTLQDYQEMAESFARIEERFPDLTMTKLTGAGGEQVIVWNFTMPDGPGSRYSEDGLEITINTTDTETFTDQHIAIVERRIDRLASLDSGRNVERMERWKMLIDPERRREAHSMYWVEDKSDQFSALMFHEFGHYIHDEYSNVIVSLDKPADTIKYGVTARARDGWNEAVAENFTLWMLGHEDAIHKDFVDVFEKISRENGG